MLLISQLYKAIFEAFFNFGKAFKFALATKSFSTSSSLFKAEISILLAGSDEQIKTSCAASSSFKSSIGQSIIHNFVTFLREESSFNFEF